MSDTPITNAFKKEWPQSRRHNWPCAFEGEAFLRLEKMERELADRDEQIAILRSDLRRLEQFAALYRRQTSELERQRDAYAETLRELRDRLESYWSGVIDERHPELEQEASQP